MTPTILIDPELASLLSPLTETEAGLLEHSLATDGCRDPSSCGPSRVCAARRPPPPRDLHSFGHPVRGHGSVARGPQGRGSNGGWRRSWLEGT